MARDFCPASHDKSYNFIPKTVFPFVDRFQKIKDPFFSSHIIAVVQFLCISNLPQYIQTVKAACFTSKNTQAHTAIAGEGRYICKTDAVADRKHVVQLKINQNK